jgi:hypothetical protein
VVLAACGGDSEGSTPSTPTPASQDDSGFGVFTFFDPATLVAGSEVRAPIGIGDADGPLAIADSPPEISVTVTNEDGEVSTSTVAFRSEGLPRGYYPLRFTPPAPGFYDLAVAAAGIPALNTAIELVDPSTIVIPGPGDPFPVLDTPTVDDERGVTPICTRNPVCELHDRNLPELLLDGQPSAVIISTPEFCSTAVCGPVLELLLAEAAARPEVSMLHTEVYADPATDLSQVAPIVEAMRLTFEPSVVFVDPSGTIVERLDFVFDASELGEAFDRLTS